MKIRISDRILVALAGLLMLAGCAAATAQLFFGKDVLGWVGQMLTRPKARIAIIAGVVLIALLGCYCVLMLFRRRSHKDKFILQKTENGELAISLKAMETMVDKCLETHKELNAQSVRLENQKGGLLVRIRGTVAGGVSIPLTVDALQQQIKQYVTACSGIEVREIKVQIESSGPDAKDAPFAIEGPASQALLNEGKAQDATEPADNTEKPETPEKPAEVPEAAAEVSQETTAEAAEPVAEENDVPAAMAAAELLMSEAPQEDDDRPFHQRLFSSEDKPCVMPMPPARPETSDGDAGESAEEKAEEAAEEKAEEEETEAVPDPEGDRDKPETAGNDEDAEGSKA